MSRISSLLELFHFAINADFKKDSSRESRDEALNCVDSSAKSGVGCPGYRQGHLASICCSWDAATYLGFQQGRRLPRSHPRAPLPNHPARMSLATLWTTHRGPNSPADVSPKPGEQKRPKELKKQDFPSSQAKNSPAHHQSQNPSGYSDLSVEEPK